MINAAQLRPDHNGWAMTNCPFHKDKTPSFAVNVNSGWGICHGCGKKAKVLDGDLSKLPRLKVRPSHTLTEDEVEAKTMPNSTMTELFLLGRGVSLETAEECGVRSIVEDTGKLIPGDDRVTIKKRWIVFVYHKMDGTPVYWKQRLIYDDDNEKQMRVYPRGKGSLLYNLPCLQGAKPGDNVFVVEGEMDVLSMWELGLRRVVSVPNGAGSRLTNILLEPLKRFRKVVVATDDDDAGNELANKLMRALGKKATRVSRGEAA